MLTGRAPLERLKNPNERMQKERFLNIEPIKPEEINGPASVLPLVRSMMSLNPHERFQTPSQVLDALRDVRRDVENYRTPGVKANTQRTLFLAESDESLQNVLREKLKEKGYRVLLAADPIRALDRYRQQPFDVLIVDAGTTGDNGLFVYDKIMNDADRRGVALGGILLLDEGQAEVAERYQGKPRQAALVQPVKLRALLHAIDQVLSE